MIGVERSVGPEGFTQRTSYLVNQPGLPARQVTRTIVIRPNDNRRPNDPNLPPSYDHAVTGRDKSVKVEEGTGVPQSDGAAPVPVTIDGTEPSAPPPAQQLPPPDNISGMPPPAYTPPQANSSNYDHGSGDDETTRLLV